MYVGSDLLVYYHEGVPRDFVVDEFFKPRTYAEIGVAEYFIFDPHSEYLSPALQGFRLTNDCNYVRVEPDACRRLESRQLGLRLELDGGELVIRDAASGQMLPTQADAALLREQVATQRERDRKQREEIARHEANELAAKNASLELELKRLREELDRRGVQ